jgi:hypothetical protein
MKISRTYREREELAKRLAPEDAERAITGHATSKIRTADDLASVVS